MNSRVFRIRRKPFPLFLQFCCSLSFLSFSCISFHHALSLFYMSLYAIVKNLLLFSKTFLFIFKKLLWWFFLFPFLAPFLYLRYYMQASNKVFLFSKKLFYLFENLFGAPLFLYVILCNWTETYYFFRKLI